MKYLISYILFATFTLSSCQKSVPINTTNTGGSTGSGNGNGNGNGSGGGNGGGGNGGSNPSSQNCSGYWVCLNVPGARSAFYTSSDNFYQAYGASVSSQNKVYFAGGADDFTFYGGCLDGGIEYDPASKLFRSFKLSLGRCYLAGATTGNKILFAGGREISGYTIKPVFNTVDIYDKETLQQTVATLSEPRCHLASVSFNNRAFFIGGKTQNGFSKKMDVYDGATNTWQVITMPRERGYGGAAIIGSRIYIAGGQNSSGYLRTIDIYDVETGQWSFIDAPNDHSIATVAAVNNKLIVAGGDGLNKQQADLYDVTDGEWTTVKISDSRFNMTVAVANNKVIFLGGVYSFSGENFSNEASGIDVYDDTTGTWSTGSVSPPVGGVMAASVGTQIIYVGFMWNNATTIANAMVVVSL